MIASHSPQFPAAFERINAPVTVAIDPTPAQFRMKALELALAHWSTSTYPSVFAMADDLCAWLHGQRQEPKGE